MRPPRIIIATAFFLTTVFLTFLSLRSSRTPQTITTSTSAEPKTGIQAFFSFRAAFSLFPPNAIITLTNDNTTAFLARPAAFGPQLPIDGLKGQLWIGSGFGDESIRQGPVTADAEGELGCSDVKDSFADSGAAKAEAVKASNIKSVVTSAKVKPQSRGKDEDGPFDDDADDSKDAKKGKSKNGGPALDDGTDDYLHYPLPESTVSNPNDKVSPESKGNHADIQSIQEGAEITGKVVLLSRGSCGFLEKVKWAQRRGAIALIVGDDTKGGPLIEMYARGDTSNVTIPAIFTSRTTAHLLSKLMGEDTFIEDTIDENGKPSLKVKHSGKGRKSRKKQGSSPTFTPTNTATTVVETGRAASKASNKKGATRTEDSSAAITTKRPGWFRSLFWGSKPRDSKSSRPPSSGQLDWVLVDDWKDDDDSGSKRISTKPLKKDESADANNKAAVKGKPASQPKGESKPVTGDDFIIGVQDWRDPDLVGSNANQDADSTSAAKIDIKSNEANKDAPAAKVAPKKHLGGALQEIPEWNPPLRGGSITPGSGEYSMKDSAPAEKTREKHEPHDSTPEGKSKGLLSAIFGEDEEGVEFLFPGSGSGEEALDEDDEDEGLWVTLTPTSGASPFLDTLLVLVVSPLVTLTVVYALLLIRSRIRRRRWRAPKSVVERLPVRTYQTIVPSGNVTPRGPSRVPSPTTSTVTTPLLQQVPVRSRPRSRTTTGVPEPGDLARVNSNPLQLPAIQPRAPEHEKHGNDNSEWKKHMGKQVECVVCLEDYVAGVSRVMSLPCGHEFHVECITPWLTTRRRTCPICKGDVVRSLARGSPSSPRWDPYQDDSDDDSSQQAEASNNSSSATLPRPSNDEDVEQGIISPTPTRPPRTNRPTSWRSLISSSLSTSQSPRPPQEDRNR